MERKTLTRLLADEGFGDVATVSRAPNGPCPFAAKALILQGKIRLQTEGAEQIYRHGEFFHLRAHEPRAGHHGPTGVEYLVGRK